MCDQFWPSSECGWGECVNNTLCECFDGWSSGGELDLRWHTGSCDTDPHVVQSMYRAVWYVSLVVLVLQLVLVMYAFLQNGLGTEKKQLSTRFRRVARQVPAMICVCLLFSTATMHLDGSLFGEDLLLTAMACYGGGMVYSSSSVLFSKYIAFLSLTLVSKVNSSHIITLKRLQKITWRSPVFYLLIYTLPFMGTLVSHSFHITLTRVAMGLHAFVNLAHILIFVVLVNPILASLRETIRLELELFTVVRSRGLMVAYSSTRKLRNYVVLVCGLNAIAGIGAVWPLLFRYYRYYLPAQFLLGLSCLLASCCIAIQKRYAYQRRYLARVSTQFNTTCKNDTCQVTTEN